MKTILITSMLFFGTVQAMEQNGGPNGVNPNYYYSPANYFPLQPMYVPTNPTMLMFDQFGYPVLVTPVVTYQSVVPVCCNSNGYSSSEQFTDTSREYSLREKKKRNLNLANKPITPIKINRESLPSRDEKKPEKNRIEELEKEIKNEATNELKEIFGVRNPEEEDKRKNKEKKKNGKTKRREKQKQIENTTTTQRIDLEKYEDKESLNIPIPTLSPKQKKVVAHKAEDNKNTKVKKSHDKKLVDKQSQPVSIGALFIKAKKNNDVEQLIKIYQSDNKEIKKKAAYCLASLYDPLHPKEKGVEKNLKMAIKYFRASFEELDKKVSPDIVQKLYVLYAAAGEEYETLQWDKLQSKKPYIHWVDGVQNLVKGDTQKAFKDFMLWEKAENNNLAPQIYDLFFESVDNWVNANIGELINNAGLKIYAEEISCDKTEAELGNEIKKRSNDKVKVKLCNKEGDVTNCGKLYMLAKMYHQGSKKWKEQEKNGWPFDQKAPDKKGVVSPLVVMRELANSELHEAFCYIGSLKELQEDIRVYFLKRAIDNKKNFKCKKLLHEIAKRGNFSAMTPLIQKAYDNNELESWLKQNSSICDYIKITPVMIGASEDLSKECLEQLENMKNKSGKLLVIANKIAKCFQSIYRTKGDDHSIPDQLNDVAQSVTKLGPVNDAVRENLLQSIRLLRCFMFKERYQRTKDKELQKKFMHQYTKISGDIDAQYQYLELLSSDFVNLMNHNTKRTLFFKLINKLKDTDYRIDVLGILAAYHIDIGDKEKARTYITQIENDPGYIFGQVECSLVQTLKDKIDGKPDKNEKNEEFYEKYVKYSKLCIEGFDIVKKCCEGSLFTQAAIALDDLVKTKHLLPFIKGSFINVTRKDFDAVMEKLKRHEVIKNIINTIEQVDKQYNKQINSEQVLSIRTDLEKLKSLLREYKSKNGRDYTLEKEIQTMVPETMLYIGDQKDEIDEERKNLVNVCTYISVQNEISKKILETSKKLAELVKLYDKE